MKSLVLSLLLLPLTAFAQFEDNPAQQRLWEAMLNSAPAYEMLLACEREITANLIYEDVTSIAATLVQNRRDIDIAMQMWREARAQAAMQYWDSIQGLARDPEGAVCNRLENDIIEILGAGV